MTSSPKLEAASVLHFSGLHLSWSQRMLQPLISKTLMLMITLLTAVMPLLEWHLSFDHAMLSSGHDVELGLFCFLCMIGLGILLAHSIERLPLLLVACSRHPLPCHRIMAFRLGDLQLYGTSQHARPPLRI